MNDTDVTWRENAFKKSVGIRQAGLASQLEQLRKQGSLVRRLVRKTQDGTIGTKTMEPEDEEDDTVHVGDVTIFNSPPESSVPAPPPTLPVTVGTATPSQLNSNTRSTWREMAVAAAMAASLLGAGGAGAAIATWLNRPESQPPAPATADHIDRNWELRIVE